MNQFYKLIRVFFSIFCTSGQRLLVQIVPPWADDHLLSTYVLLPSTVYRYSSDFFLQTKHDDTSVWPTRQLLVNSRLSLCYWLWHTSSSDNWVPSVVWGLISIGYYIKWNQYIGISLLRSRLSDLQCDNFYHSRTKLICPSDLRRKLSTVRSCSNSIVLSILPVRTNSFISYHFFSKRNFTILHPPPRSRKQWIFFIVSSRFVYLLLFFV